MKKITPCIEWEKKLSSTNSEDLSPSEQAALTAHLATCSACTFTCAQHHEMDNLLRGLPPIEPLPALPSQLLHLWEEKDTKGASPTIQSQSKRKTAPRQTDSPQLPSLIRSGALLLIFKRSPAIGAVIVLIIASLFLIYQLPQTYTAKFNSIAQKSANATAQATATTPTLQATATATAKAATASALQATATATAKAAAATALQATATATAKAATASALQATATAYTKTVAAGNPALNDPLQSNSGNNWDVTSITGGGGCAFTGGVYHASMPQEGFIAPCFAETTNFSYFAYQAQMTIVKGDQGGIAFRADASKGTFYYFHISTSGTYALEIYTNYNPAPQPLIQGKNPAIKTGLNQTNLIAVLANSNSLVLYVNKQQIASVNDGTYSQGQIGVIAESVQNPTDVAFTNAEVWTTP